jgi:hypothetical protein
VFVQSSTDTARPHNLLVLLPGETFDPGKTTNPKGISGTPNFTAILGHANPRTGETFPVTVLAVDEFYNRVFDTDNPLVKLAADPTLYPTIAPSDTFTLNSGSATVSVTLKTAGAAVLTATEEAPAENIEYSTGTSSNFTVDVNAATQLQVLVQGESALPGSPTGKSGSVTTATAGNAYTVTVRAVDNNYNLVTSAGANVLLAMTEPKKQDGYYSAVVSFQVTVQVLWKTTPIAPRLQEIAAKICAGEPDARLIALCVDFTR